MSCNSRRADGRCSLAENLAQDDEQEALAALALQDRLLYSITSPLLYRQPRLTEFKQLGDWVSTMKQWEQPLRSDAQARELPVMQSISFGGLHHPMPRSACDHCGDWRHGTRQHDQTLQRLLPLLTTRLFDHLHTLSIVDCAAELLARLLARLLGPLQPLRSNSRASARTQEPQNSRASPFFELGIDMMIPLVFSFICSFPNIDVWLRTEHRDDEESDEYFQTLVYQSLTDYNSFARLGLLSSGTPPESPALVAAQPAWPYPFTRLTSLKLSVIPTGSGEEIFIVLCGGLFPVLRHCTILGEYNNWTLVDEERFLFRRAVHRNSPRSPGQLLPPQLSGEMPDDEDALWDPLSAEEIGSEAYRTYRGPSLDLLDLSGLSLVLV